MGQALYRKYRSKSLDGVIGQDHITSTLKNALKNDSISHAYLFAGPRGVGKTSVARILAHAINGFEYDGEESHLDIIEIDAASNRGIDEIRDLREKVAIAPVNGSYKVYIIDEVHMLTTPAFNALLKTLEEPPRHVVFILATTDIHKLPATIVSRTQRHNFQSISQSDAVRHLKQIAQQESIQINQAALELIATHGEGSFRDSISLLDQLSGQDETITAESVARLLGLPPEAAVEDLLANLARGETASVASQLSNMAAQGYHPAMTAKVLAARLRQSILDENNQPLASAAALELLERLIDVPASRSPEQSLEVALIKTCLSLSGSASTNVKSAAQAAPQPKEPVESEKPAASAKKPEPEHKPTQKAPEQPNEKPKTPPKKTSGSKINLNIEEVWPQLLDSVKANHNTLYGILRMAEPDLQDKALVLNFNYSFHQKRMQEPRYQTIVVDNIKALTGQVVSLECLHSPRAAATPKEEAPTTKPEPTVAENNQDLKAISNIFGGGELLES